MIFLVLFFWLFVGLGKESWSEIIENFIFPNIFYWIIPVASFKSVDPFLANLKP